MLRSLPKKDECYLAPEIIDKIENGKSDDIIFTKSDIYSLGVILIEVITLEDV